MRASVQASHPDSPSRVRNVCRKEYSTHGLSRDGLAFSFSALALISAFACRKARACCFLQTGMVDVTALCWSGPHPAVSRFLSEFPAGLENKPHPRSHGNRTAGSRSLAVSDQQGPIPAMLPVDVLPAHPVALFWAHSAVSQHRSNRLRGSLQCSRYFSCSSVTTVGRKVAVSRSVFLV